MSRTTLDNGTVVIIPVSIEHDIQPLRHISGSDTHMEKRRKAVPPYCPGFEFFISRTGIFLPLRA